MGYNTVAESGAMLLARTWNKAKYKKELLKDKLVYLMKQRVELAD